MNSILIKLSKEIKILLCLVVDLLLNWLSLFLAFYLRLDGDIFNYYYSFLILSLLIPLVSLPVYYKLNLYRNVVRYMGPQISFSLFKASFYSFFILTLLIVLLKIDVPRSIPFLYVLISAIILGFSRYIASYLLMSHRFGVSGVALSWLNKSIKIIPHGVPVAIYGAGEAGVQLVEALNISREYEPVAFIDDDSSIQGRMLSGKEVYKPSNLKEMIAATQAKEILLAIPSADSVRRTDIIKYLEGFGLPIKTMPSIRDIASGRLKLQDIQAIDVVDVLGRKEVKPIPELMSKHIYGQVVMVTGAGGSIGSEMARQAISQAPRVLILFEHSEYNLYAIDQELQKVACRLNSAVKIVSVLGSITDPARLVDVMTYYEVDTLYHAAAYKHVPLVQYNIAQGLKNNVLGTLYTAQAAIIAGVKNFVLISTDKAVRPTNVMGASKRLSEMVLQALSQENEVKFYQPELFGLQSDASIFNHTCFTMVRFGNVLGSSGSVIPLFHTQIRSGGPVTVTHPDITRYFMTIPEAAQLVIQAGAMGQGGDVFVLDMGKPVRIVDLAKQLISLSGLSIKDARNPNGDIEIIFSGLRPGEKLYEELLIGDDVMRTEHDSICRASEEMIVWSELQLFLDRMLYELIEHQYDVIQELLIKYVTGYKSNGKVRDWLDKQVGNNSCLVDSQKMSLRLCNSSVK